MNKVRSAFSDGFFIGCMFVGGVFGFMFTLIQRPIVRYQGWFALMFFMFFLVGVVSAIWKGYKLKESKD